MATVQSSEVSSPGTDAKNNSSFKVKLSSCVVDSSCELVMFVVMIFKSNSILYIDQKFTIQRVVIDLVCNSRYPVNGSTDVFYFFFFLLLRSFQRPLGKIESESVQRPRIQIHNQDP